jgi:hypothetical protein
MFIQPILGWVKSLAQSYSKPQTYGSALEAYIVSNEPQNACDVDRLTREFDSRMSNRSYGGFPC